MKNMITKKYEPLIREDFRWSDWAAPRDLIGGFDHDSALTGEDLIVTLHSDFGLPNTPVVFFSGKVDEKELEERARTCGANGYISKNIEANELNEKLRSFL